MERDISVARLTIAVCILTYSSIKLLCFRMSAQDIWLRKYQELWEKLEDNTKSSFCTALWKWLVLQINHVMQTATSTLQPLCTYVLSSRFSKDSIMCMHRLGVTEEALTVPYIQFQSVLSS